MASTRREQFLKVILISVTHKLVDSFSGSCHLIERFASTAFTVSHCSILSFTRKWGPQASPAGP